MFRLLITLAVATLSSACFCQIPSTGGSQTSGPCSPAVSGQRNTFNIRCNIDSAQGKQVIGLLNKVLSNQMDVAEVMKKLDEILAASRRPAQVVDAPNGIGSVGGVIVNPTVNNFAPLSRRLPESAKASLVSCLSKHPGYVAIVTWGGQTAEAHALAEDWLDVFKQAGWDVDGGIGIEYSSGTIVGTEIQYPGTSNPPAENSRLDLDTPGGSAAYCISTTRLPGAGPGHLAPIPGQRSDLIQIVIAAN